MSLQAVEDWVDRLPPQERDLPLLIYEGESYSPNEVLNIVRRGDKLAEALQKRVESGDFGTPQAEKKKLAQERVKKLLKDRPVDVVRLTVPGGKPDKTSAEIEKEVDDETGFGKKLIEQEEEYLEHIRRK